MYWSLVLLCSLLQGIRGEELELTSDEPVVLDANITFYGTLKYGDPEEMYRWKWIDSASPGHSYFSDHYGTEESRNFTVSYPSSQYGQAEYFMKLTIYKFELYFWRHVTSKTVFFNVTQTLQGRLLVKQGGQMSENMDGQSIVNSVNSTDIVIKFHDPEKYLKQATKIQYFWFIDDVAYGQTNQGVFSYNFSRPGEHVVEATIIADFNTSQMHDIGSADLTEMEQRERGIKMGILRKRVISKAPVHNLTISGQKTLKHGQLVDLSIDCEGTGAWLFCWKQVPKGYNITGNETCDASTYRKTCDFHIMWYFKNSDTYNLLLILSNDVSSHLEVVAVTIYEVASSLPLSIVIIPMVAAIFAIILLISGIAVYSTFKSNLAVEVADFDFNNAEDEELQYKTFWERLRESFGTAFTGSDAESEGSSVSGRRSVQMQGPAGIGYGSIT